MGFMPARQPGRSASPSALSLALLVNFACIGGGGLGHVAAYTAGDGDVHHDETLPSTPSTAATSTHTVHVYGGATKEGVRRDARDGSDESLFNVKDFGAKGDGVSDDTLAVQTAIEAASNKTIVFSLPGWHDAIYSRSTVLFPSGHYILSSKSRRTVLRTLHHSAAGAAATATGAVKLYF